MKKPAVIVVSAAVLLVLVFFLVRSFTSSRQLPTITLPTPAAQSSVGELPSGDLINITPETVKTTLATLSRIESYSRTYSVTTYWSSGESTDKLSVWQKGESLKMTLDHAGSIKNLLIIDRDLYVWYDNVGGSSKYTLYEDFDYSGTDRFTRLLTYEELFAADTQDIQDAGYVQLLGEPCIYVCYKGQNDYVNQINVSINSGLLVSAQIYDGEALIYSMESQTTELSAPQDEVFVPPKD